MCKTTIERLVLKLYNIPTISLLIFTVFHSLQLSMCARAREFNKYSCLFPLSSVCRYIKHEIWCLKLRALFTLYILSQKQTNPNAHLHLRLKLLLSK